MKAILKLLLALTILCGEQATVYAQARNVQQTATCKCYCSDLCGLRDAHADDEPFYDSEFDQCFCKQRDKDNYLKNGCDQKPKISPSEITCCDHEGACKVLDVEIIE